MKPEVEAATKAVEDASGIPVVVQSDPSMKLIARVVVARGSAPAHVVLFNPKYGEATDYHIVFQCGFVLRSYQTPSEQRFDLGSTQSGRQEAGRLIAEHLRRGKVNLAQLIHVKETAFRHTVARAKRGDGPEDADLLLRLKRGYRILLTRAIKGMHVWFEDQETKEYVTSLLPK